LSWHACTLGEVVKLQRGHDLPERVRVAGSVPVVSSSGVTGWHSVAKAEPPGVVTGRYGTIGEVFFIDEPYWPLNTALYAVDFRGNDPRFVAYLLRNALRNYQTEKAAVPGVDRNVLHQMPVKSANRPTQQRVVELLSAYDDLIQNNRKRIALLEEAARLLYREWFVHLRFPGHEHVKVVDGVPSGWHRWLLSELCPPKIGIQTGPFGSQLHQSDYTEQGVPVVMPKDMQGYRIETVGIARIPEELGDRLGRHRMEVGDTVYGRRGDIGRRAFIGRRQSGWLCGTGSLRIRPDAAKIVPRYLFETLGSPQTAGFIANQAKGSTMPNLSAGALQRVPILCPPMSLQRTFVEAIEPFNEQVEVLSEQSQKLAAARDLLLPRLMNGEIAV
jgi:type I restriction enzyme, S subunit